MTGSFHAPAQWLGFAVIAAYHATRPHRRLPLPPRPRRTDPTLYLTRELVNLNREKAR